MILKMTKTSNMTKGFYVVWVGRVPGVYSTWAAASEQVTGFPGARYAGASPPAGTPRRPMKTAMKSSSWKSGTGLKAVRHSFNNKEIPGRYCKDEGEAQV